jgi:hypothetical protein
MELPVLTIPMGYRVTRARLLSCRIVVLLRCMVGCVFSACMPYRIAPAPVPIRAPRPSTGTPAPSPRRPQRQVRAPSAIPGTGTAHGPPRPVRADRVEQYSTRRMDCVRPYGARQRTARAAAPHRVFADVEVRGGVAQRCAERPIYSSASGQRRGRGRIPRKRRRMRAPLATRSNDRSAISRRLRGYERAAGGNPEGRALRAPALFSHASIADGTDFSVPRPWRWHSAALAHLLCAGVRRCASARARAPRCCTAQRTRPCCLARPPR